MKLDSRTPHSGDEGLYWPTTPTTGGKTMISPTTKLLTSLCLPFLLVGSLAAQTVSDDELSPSKIESYPSTTGRSTAPRSAEA